jgi:hypothetical protein
VTIEGMKIHKKLFQKLILTSSSLKTFGGVESIEKKLFFIDEKSASF